MNQPLHLAVVDDQSALSRCRSRQRQGDARIIELTVPVFHATDQAGRLHARQTLQRLMPTQELRAAQAVAAGQQVVHLEPDAIERHFPPLVGGHDECQRLRQMGRVVQEAGALVQRFRDQRNVALRQVAHPAMDQFGGSGRGACGKVTRLHQHHAEAAHGGVQRDAQSGRAAADDREIPDLLFAQRSQKIFAPREPGRVLV